MTLGDHAAAALAFSQGLDQLDGAWLPPPDGPPSRVGWLHAELLADRARARRNRLADEIHRQPIGSVFAMSPS